MAHRPLIAITATVRQDEGVSRVRLNVAYPRAVERAGGTPVIVAPFERVADVSRILDAVDGLLLTGGEDVEPARYGAVPQARLGPTSATRDATEIALLELARERRLPTLAICRGIQLANVALGGTLIQDLPSERPGPVDHDPPTARDARAHEVRVESGSRLASMLGSARLDVNSFHHQAVDRVAEGLRATAWAPDGVIEGVEWTGDDWWMVAVQWHPEELDGSWERGLFTAFVQRCARAEPVAAAPAR